MLQLNGLSQALQFRESCRFAVCYKITRATDGQIFRFTNADHALTVQTGTWENSQESFETFSPADGPSSESWSKETGTAPATGAMFGIFDSANLNPEDFRIGLFDDAQCDVYGVDWRYPWSGPLFHDRYWFGDIEWSGSRYRVNLESLISRVNRKIGRVYARTCDAVLGDARCGKDITLLREAATVTAVDADRPRTIFESGAGAADHFYTLGYVEWTGGTNAISGSDKQQVKRYKNADGEFRLWLETPYNIEVGDTFIAVVGCGKEFHADCRIKLSNKANFRGFPHLGGSDKILKTPDSKK